MNREVRVRKPVLVFRGKVLRLHARDPQDLPDTIFHEKTFNSKNKSGKKIDYTMFLILLVKIMLCSKHHCSKVLD